MKQYTLMMSCRDYFIIKNYLVELNQLGKFTNDAYMQRFYKAFAIDATLKLPRRSQKRFDEKSTVLFVLKEEPTLLSTVGLFCREHSMDQRVKNPELANALNHLKDCIAAELMDVLGL